MDLKKISRDINAQLNNYEIGKIQQFRVNAKKLSRPKSYNLFPDEPINKNWTFHIGGRTELQFNIGNESEGLRFGFAFSLEPSRSLPEPAVLYPKIRKLNYIILSKPYLFYDYKMWIWKNGERTDIFDVRIISEQDISVGNFIFIGKIQKVYDLSEIMKTFDAMFPIYKEVEGENSSENRESVNKKNRFVFSDSKYRLPQKRHFSMEAKELDFCIRHSMIQEKLVSELKQQYGANNVVAENYIGLNRIDVVVRVCQKYYFYEIKVANSARDCIRDAFGQLLDYCFYPNVRNASRIFVVGEAELDSSTKEYLEFINKEFSIPIGYLRIEL